MKKDETMSKTQRTLVTFLLDRTGSMMAIKDDTIGGFNTYVEGLQGDGGTTLIDFTLIQFDSISLDKTCVSVPIEQAPKLSNENFEPRASTPLIDAAYKTIKAVEKFLEGKEDAPKIVVCIMTDGQENASREHSWDDLNALIKEKSAAGWQFNFLGASIDAYEQGAKMGIAAGQTMSYDSTNPVATRAAYRSRASNTMAFASGTASGMSISDDEKEAAGDKFYKSATAKPAKATKPVVTKPKDNKPKGLVDDFTL